MWRFLLIGKYFASVLLISGLGLASQNVLAEPQLPSGLGSEKKIDEPLLPQGLSAPVFKPEEMEKEDVSEDNLPFEFDGFWEVRTGARLVDDDTQHSQTLAETRLHLELSKDFDVLSANLSGDFLYDHLADEHSVDLERGTGFFDLREANIEGSPFENTDMKLGRQILTWGTGDLVFINDLFPKDWHSFFLGRDEEYLKAPSDALKTSFYSDLVNIDIIYTPNFDSDRFLDGRRISYYSPSADDIVGRPTGIITEDYPSSWFKDDEIAIRLHQNIGAYEVAGYGYHGRWKSPEGQDPSSGNAIFPDLNVIGASIRGPLGPGIANLELGYYDSSDDENGSNALIRNSETRFLLGYEQEIAQDLTLGLQWYIEHMLDHGAYERSLPAGSKIKDENRHLITSRLTWLTHNQNTEWSLFAFYSPTDQDGYLRPKVSYKIDDFWTIEAGGNIFFGEDEHTFFGQFRDNTNAFISLRYGF